LVEAVRRTVVLRWNYETNDQKISDSARDDELSVPDNDRSGVFRIKPAIET
jgi:hypothetical protein